MSPEKVDKKDEIKDSAALISMAEKGIKVYDTMVGNFMTAIDMAGASVTMLKLDDELKTYFDAPVNTIAYKKGV